MNLHSSLIYSLVCCPVILLWVGTATAKTPPGPPDFTEEAFWKGNDCALVRVTEALLKDTDEPAVTLQIEQLYSGPKGWADKSFPLSKIGFGWDPKTRKNIEVTIEKGDALVVWHINDTRTYIDAMKIAGPPAENSLVKTLGAIAKVRAVGTEAALKNACSSDDPAVIHYAFLRLAAVRSQKADADLAGRLKTLRDEASLSLSVRFEANRLLPNYSANPDQARAEGWKWARGVFETAKTEKCYDLMQMLPDLMAGFATRDERVTYFANLVQDESKPDPVRMASIGALTEERCFDFKDASGKVASKDFSVLLSLLNSKNGEFRKAGASQPWHVCTFIPSDESRIARAKETIVALTAAIKEEPDKSVKTYMTAFLHFLEEVLSASQKGIYNYRCIRLTE
jgi:hypothetical protein